MNAALPLQHPAPVVVEDQSELVRKHSKLGAASVLIALGLPLLFLFVFLIVILLQVRIANEGFTYFIVIFGSSSLGIIGHLAGLILGVVAASRKQNKKLLPVLGIIFNSVPMLLAVIICVLFVAFLIHPFPLGPK